LIEIKNNCIALATVIIFHEKQAKKGIKQYFRGAVPIKQII